MNSATLVSHDASRAIRISLALYRSLRARAVNSREVARAFLDLFVESRDEEEEEGLVSRRGESYGRDSRGADQVQRVLFAMNAVSFFK